MMGFIESFEPLAQKIFKKYKIEAILITAALLIAGISIVVFVVSNQDRNSEKNFSEEKIVQEKPALRIYAEASGAVQKPGVYEMVLGDRIKDLVDRAGGLSQEADKSFFSRNFNLARAIKDQEKIYIPSLQEINSGQVLENQHNLDYTQPQTLNQDLAVGRIHLNTASLDELDSLPNLGKTTAQKIIDRRPYNSTDELVSRKILNQNLFNKIKTQIEL